ncbi:MAG: hypothetical protein Q9214_005140 [Letrouitia sp. 1 TL-2023]
MSSSLIQRTSVAAIRYHNGTIHNLIKFDGSAEYRDLMKTLAVSEPGTFALESPATSHPDQRQQQHHLGLRFPPSPQPQFNDAIRVLSNALIALKASIGPLLSPYDAFPPALPTYPNFPGLTYSLIQSAMAAAAIPLLGDARTPPVAAAAAANGLGLCENYTKPDICEDEEARMRMSRVLAIEYTSAALAAILSPFQASRKGFDWMEVRDWDLGSSAVPAGEEAEVRYWEHVKQVIQTFPARVSRERPVTDVIVMGDSALEKTFLGVLREALREALPNNDDSRSLVVGFPESGAALVDPTFAAARGAAEFGKRLMESPNGCVETRICKYWRRLVG